MQKHINGRVRVKPIQHTGSKGIIQRLIRVFIDECHKKGFSIVEIEEYIRHSGKLNMYKGKISEMAQGRMRPYQHFYMFDVLFEAIGLDFADFVIVTYSNGLPYKDPVVEVKGTELV